MGQYFSCNPKEVNSRRMKFAQSLRENGHTCVRILESYPCIVVWCEEKACAGMKKSTKEKEIDDGYRKSYSYKYSQENQSSGS